MYSVLSNKKNIKFVENPYPYLIIDDAITKIELKILRAAFDDTLNNINKLNHIDVGLLEYDERFIFLEWQ